MPVWVRKATVLIYQSGIVSDADITGLADLCLSGDDSYIVSGINLIGHEVNQGFSISTINSIEGVNAILSDKPLEFGNEGLTVVYGLNGAGKSGYIRMLKMASGAKYREDIKSNIYSSKKSTPKATITIKKEDGTTEKLACDLRKPAQHEVLRGIDIFDTKISHAYVNEAKEATYEPWVFSLFAELANVALRIKSELEKRKDSFPIVEYGFPEKYKATKAYSIAQEISHDTDVSTFPSSWTEADEEALCLLKKKNQIEAIKASLRQYEQQSKTIGMLIQYFTAFEEYFSDEHWQILLEARETWKNAEQELKAAQLLFSENADEIDAESVSVAAWKNLWKYAHAYAEQVQENRGEGIFTSVGSICPLCRQPISDDTVSERMGIIDAYVNGKASDGEKKAFGAFESIVVSFPKVKTTQDIDLAIETADITNYAAEIHTIHSSLIAFAEVLSGDLHCLNSEELARISVTRVLNILQTAETSLKRLYNETRQLVDSDAQKQLENDILESEANKFLASIFELIKCNVVNYKKIREIDNAIKLTATNKITSRSKALAEEIITSDYIQRFESELQELTKNAIAVKMSQQKAGRGKIPYRVVLSDANGNQLSPEDILSEGENRVTSLAAFFAEASGRTQITPLIVDDPISSLDYSFEAKVIERLVKVAQNRQVVVFTHRISMVVGLYEKTKELDVKYKEISLLSSKTKKGVPSENSNIGGKVGKQLNNLINSKLSKLKKLDEFSEEYQSLFHNICQEFRNIVEKSVEDVLIGEVVKRFRRDVQTKGRLHSLASITVEDCDLIDRLMTRYSYYDHSMSDETPLQEIGIDELENDLTELQRWIQQKTK